ncbi:GNAT family N-acetyltransferase [Specibacter cremeus]|uniref:GNAT family N-acetyltransferase n=1 Tax=Specibacter cremeus TaxID=1629051 RepID=UPI000F7939DD|nr:GNAT family N-acetyltransferase [Specibacter cremeus]
MSFSLRPATVDDAEDLVRLHLACHEEAYARHLPAEWFAMRRATAAERVAHWRDDTVPLPTVAYDDGGLVGMAKAGPARYAEAPAETELYMIYTLARVHGTGVGQALLDAELGDRAAFLWVLEDNPRARAFYARNGFVPDGTRQLLPADWHSLPEICLVRGARG